MSSALPPRFEGLVVLVVFFRDAKGEGSGTGGAPSMNPGLPVCEKQASTQHTS